MRKLGVFNFISLDGYYKGLHDDISWNTHTQENSDFSAENLKAGSTLLFGRVTYEMMFSFWPSPMAYERMPLVAEGMNKAEKIVFSRTLKKAEWQNTRLIKDNMVEEIKKMKQLPGKDLTLLGSGSVLTQLADAGLIDEYAIMLNPVALGAGTSVFKNLKQQLNLKLTGTRTFKSGSVLLTYSPAKI